MTPEEYRAEQSSILDEALLLIILYFQTRQRREMTENQWFYLIEALYDFLVPYRIRSAVVARTFYDTERSKYPPLTPDPGPTPLPQNVVRLDDRRPDRHDINIPRFESDWLHQALEPVKDDFLKPNTPDAKLVELGGLAGKQVSAGGRRTILNGVRTDSRSVGWARLEGGGESCAFCKMLISRGPVFKATRQGDGYKNAGLNVESEQRALEVWRQFQRTNDEDVLLNLMNKWHENCDCIVVPVFSENNWFGRDKYLEYERDWYDAQKWAKRLTGKETFGKEKYRAFRRYLYAKQGNNPLAIAA